MFMNHPLVGRHFDVFPQNGFGAGIVQSEGICYALKLAGRCPDATGKMGSMNHEGCCFASLSFLCAEKGNNADQNSWPMV